ncbi:MAG: hypothetical protein K0U41_07035 [Gammaproteobacteria bacterium]|nr:hypothetical protein [Gammaproteobacteria bacterium]
MYVVEAFIKADGNGTGPWGDNVDLSDANTAEKPILFGSNKLYRILPNRELARVFDDVPLKAKAQELVEDRIVYGNYETGYDIVDLQKTYEMIDGERQEVSERMVTITPNFQTRIALNQNRSDTEIALGDIIGDTGEKNLKSDRDYEVGIVYGDRFGRQTPVLTSQLNTVHVPINRANRRNRLQVTMNSKAPEWAKYYRFFVKNVQGTSYNIIPLQVIADPHDQTYAWCRLSAGDVSKVSEGENVLLKLNNGAFLHDIETGQEDRILVKVEQIGFQNRNFLEIEPPRETPGVEPTESDPNPIVELQAPGLWMKIANKQGAAAISSSTIAGAIKSRARGNSAARLDNYNPVRNATSYIEDTIRYSANESVIDEDTALEITVSGNYDPTTTSFMGNAGSGSMRIVITIGSANTFSWSYQIAAGDGDNPRVVNYVGGTSTAITTTMALPLANGLSVTFGLGTYAEGDRYVIVARRSENILWGWRGPRGNPNSTSNAKGSNAAFGGRRAVLIFPPADAGESVPGGSRVSFDVEDGMGTDLVRDTGNAHTISLRGTYNTGSTPYDNIEEWLFESGLWNAGDIPRLEGSDALGSTIGIHQMGFWRGDTVYGTKTNVPFNNVTPDNQPRVSHNAEGQIHMMIQSGPYNAANNANSNDYRMEGTLRIARGRVTTADPDFVSVIFETLPSESNLDIYYEVGNTFTCLNGIHYGNDMTDSQRIGYLDDDGNTTFLPTGEAELTETSLVSPITVDLDYFNCIAWSNGVESVAIRDAFTATDIIDAGAKASTVFDEYQRTVNIADLIYSGRFNDSTGINNLNQFSSASTGNRTIIKEMDSSYGSIQKLYSENTDLMVFQEDKINIVQVDKNALFNADGTSNVSASSTFLNQTIPIIGEYGISLNPESFAIYGPTKYCSDRNRGVILEIEGRQAIEISDLGMRDFFRDNLADNTRVIGSYDDYHDQFLVTMRPDFGNLNNNPNIERHLISTKAFLSRNEACRFPEDKLQFASVFEFYYGGEPPGFQIGDIIYKDSARTVVYDGDDHWFIWRRPESSTATLEADTVGNSGRFTLNQTLPETLLATQVVTVNRTAASITTTHTAVVSEILADGSVRLQFDDTATFTTGDTFTIDIPFKFAINIDRFGLVIRKQDCAVVPPLNHDAFRASLNGYSSAREACGNGVVSRILYHNGGPDRAIPRRGDFVYDSPYASDEYVELYQLWQRDYPYNALDRVVRNNSVWEAIREVSVGIEPTTDNSDDWIERPLLPVDYKQGRTNRNGWYQVFDGDNFEDWVIYILRGEVQDSERCAAITEGRTPVRHGAIRTRNAGEGADAFATRVCASIPANVAFFFDRGTGEPEIGDVMFEDNYTQDHLSVGSYSIDGGAYVTLDDDGIVIAKIQCVVRTCFTDIINAYGRDTRLFDEQLKRVQTEGTTLANTLGQFTFLGVIDEDIYSNTDRQLAPAVTIRWYARGSERYPANPNDFYEQRIDTGLIPGQPVSLTNPQFLVDSIAEPDLQFSIAEFCYNRTLVPQTTTNRYFRGTATVLALSGQTATDVPALAGFPYPGNSAATGVARIVDVDGNQGTGTLEVLDQVYYSRLDAPLSRQYYVEDTLNIVLDGTNGIGDSTTAQRAQLDSVIIDGERRYGLWWAFDDNDGEALNDGSAASQAILIDINGRDLAIRIAPFLFTLNLGYGVNNDVVACGNITLDPLPYLTNNDDFEDVTTFVDINGNVPLAGIYAWDDPGNKTISRRWNGSAFDLTYSGDGVDACPSTTGSLPSIVARYTDGDVQDGVCNRGSFDTFYLRGGTDLANLAAEYDAANPNAQQIYRIADGSSGIVSSGFFQGPNVDVPGSVINYEWTTGTSNRLQVTQVGCDEPCGDSRADNFGEPGDCRFPSFCGDESASNFDARAIGSVFGRDDSLCIFPQPPTTYTVSVVINTDNLNAPQGALTAITASPLVAGVAGTSGEEGDTFGFAGGSIPTITDTDVYRLVNGVAITQVITTSGVAVSINGEGIIGTSNVVITLTYTGDVETIPTMVLPDGCTMVGADNFDASSNGLGQCYFEGAEYVVRATESDACDLYNGASDPSTLSRQRFYHTDPGLSTAVGATLYILSGGNYTQSSASRWYTADGLRSFRTINGVIAELSICDPFQRAGLITSSDVPNSVAIGDNFNITVTLNDVVGYSTVYWRFTGIGLANNAGNAIGVLSSIVSNGSSSLTPALQIVSPGAANQARYPITVRAFSDQGGTDRLASLNIFIRTREIA